MLPPIVEVILNLLAKSVADRVVVVEPLEHVEKLFQLGLVNLMRIHYVVYYLDSSYNSRVQIRKE